jgi:uncharacterized protein (TIGR00661 family)
MKVLKGNKILIAAMDWGMGHATRCVPIIRRLQKQDYEIILASSGNGLAFFKKYFPEITAIEKPGYNITYPEDKSVTAAIFFKIPSILKTIFREHIWLKKVIRQYGINEVLSDNCYGLWNRKIHSVFITHQLNVKCPAGLKFLEPIISLLIRSFIKKYDECYIPDYQGTFNYSGELSHVNKLPSNAKFIGLLSRFNDTITEPVPEPFDIAILLSGPEPQRTILENKCIRLLKNQNKRCCIIRGLPGEEKQKVNTKEITWYNHLSDEELKSILLTSKKIICRSGYSTIMDLVQLGVKALLIPTPGQTEQEYLALFNKEKEQFETIKQDKLKASDLIREVNQPAIRRIAPYNSIEW